MTVKDKYFTIKINAKSPEELDRRIADGAKYRYNGCHVFRHYGAIMRRANTK